MANPNMLKQVRSRHTYMLTIHLLTCIGARRECGRLLGLLLGDTLAQRSDMKSNFSKQAIMGVWR